MSRSKLIRALLAAASLLGAVPLMAQTPTTASAVPAFPVGHYTLEALDSTHAPPPGITVEFTTNTLKVKNGDQVLETYASVVTGDKWEISEFGGNCPETGSYRWHVAGDVVWMELINDPCVDRAQSITSVRFHKQS
ncbi:MAG TPA: hypothetical protein VG940_00810 [Gemmatimonadales bacterium]|nr:hypothetical protein [Gemmatimonadales bacterium]